MSQEGYEDTYNQNTAMISIHLFDDGISSNMDDITDIKSKILTSWLLKNGGLNEYSGPNHNFFETEYLNSNIQQIGYYDTTIIITNSYQITKIHRISNIYQSSSSNPVSDLTDYYVDITTNYSITSPIKFIGFDVNNLMGIGDLEISTVKYKDLSIIENDATTMYVNQLGNANAQEFDMMIYNFDNSIYDNTLVLFSTDGTYEITSMINNTGEKDILNIPENTKKVIIRNIKPKGDKVIPTVSIHSSKYLINYIPNNITIECEKAD